MEQINSLSNAKVKLAVSLQQKNTEISIICSY